MFKLANPDETYPATVTIRVPTEKGWEEQEMTCRFRCVPTNVTKKITLNEDLVAEVLADWEGVEDHDGKPLPFNDENVRMLGRIPYVAEPICLAYFERFDPEKNS